MSYIKLILFILVIELIGVLGSFFTTPSINTWYAQLIKPSFNPPNWIFAPVWTALYALIGIALYLIWESNKKKERRCALVFFSLQLAFNFLWSVIFFYLHLPLLAFIEILILWFLILLTIIKSLKVQKWAGYLLIPYLLWVSFASVLNFSIYYLNR